MALAQGQGIRTSSLDFAIDFLDAVIDRSYPVVWALPGDNDSVRPSPSITGILRSLISQLLDLESGQPQNGTNAISLDQFQANTSIRHWFQMLERCITALPRLFIIIDTSLVEYSLGTEAADEEYFTLSEFIKVMSGIVTRRGRDGLKVVIVSWKFDTGVSIEAREIFQEMQFATDMGRRVQRLMRQPKYRAILRRKGQEFSKKFTCPVDELA
jgi:hypothetical protein